MQKGFTPILILIGVLLIAGVAGGAFYLGRVSTPKLESQNPVFTSQSSPTPTALHIDETVGWKTYTDEVQKFAIKYPSNYIRQDIELDGYYNSPIFYSPSLMYDESGKIVEGNSMQVFITKYWEFGTGKEVIKTLDDIEQEIKSAKSGPKYTLIERVDLNGVAAIKTISDHYQDRSTRYYLVEDGKEFRIGCTYSLSDIISSKTCDEILMTFTILQ